ncbi:Pleckstrin domain-containing family H member 1 [Gossypium arboreum]|uniref:Pleckstrin domain-containing family H member 1 n=1 Tax=Gossypium arboreum TaxID=29729 RepID=A0A0B0Q2G4_GOSAR|nr:Pleckstrin domain-containing family H member 1 [Gossypium arboreum]
MHVPDMSYTSTSRSRHMSQTCLTLANISRPMPCPRHGLTLAHKSHVLPWFNHGLFHQFISERSYSFYAFHPI